MLLHRVFVCATILLLLFSLSVAAQRWRPVAPLPGDNPSPRSNTAAVYDPLRHRMVIFGGKTAGGFLNDVWSFDLATQVWLELTPAAGPAPAPRHTANGVYDPAADLMLMWSGQGSGLYNDIWAFDLAAGRWSQFLPPDPRPQVRYGAASVFDPQAGELVGFGGFTSQGRFNDTWRFDPAANAWSDVSPAGVRPIPRCLHTAAYDVAGHRMIMYGGASSAPLGDIWAFDLLLDQWQELTPAQSPPGRYFTASVYDARNHRFLMFGGNLGGGVRTNETWSFDFSGNAWEQLLPAGAAPDTREGAAAVYIEAQDRLLLFGGEGTVFFNDLWSLDSLSVATSVDPPSPRGFPGDFDLGQNFPNPFNPLTIINYQLPIANWVTLKVYDLLGREVKTLVDGPVAAGRHAVQWNGANDAAEPVAGGVYFYRLIVGRASSLSASPRFVQTRKMVLLR